MLVSALLITVTSASLFTPPYYDQMNDVNMSAPGYRLYFYVNAMANLLFITSIISGVCFVENAMSRAYCAIDKFILIIEQYSYKNLSEYTAVLGAFLFIISLFISIWKTYKEVDCLIFCIIGGITMVFLLKVLFVTLNQAAIRQAYRVLKFQPLVDSAGRLKPEFYPKPSEDSEGPTRLAESEIRDMFASEAPILNK